MEIPELDNLIKYQHKGVINRFQEEYPNNNKIPETIFMDLMKVLWVRQKHALDRETHPDNSDFDFKFFIVRPAFEYIDNMWHIFLLYTKDYKNFCSQYFSEFIDHNPTTDDEKHFIITLFNIGNHITNRFIGFQMLTDTINFMLGK
jgi:hypothetical protein